MVDQLVIGTAHAPEQLRQCLERELAEFARHAAGRGAGAVPPQFTEHARGTWTFFACRLPLPAGRGRGPARGGHDGGREGEAIRHELRSRLARALTAYIHEEHRVHLMQRLIARRYAHLAPDERQAVLRHARERLAGLSTRDRELRRLLAERLEAYLERAEILLVEGFLRFRCREYVEELEHVVDRSVDEFLLDREYRDFVRLLKQFVDVQPPRFRVVHVLVEPSGAFRLVDEGGQPVEMPGGASTAAPADIAVTDPEDLLLSALITVGAERFVLHPRGRLRDDTLETLDQVFAGRVETCGGCERCRPRSRRPVTPGP